MNIRAAVKGYRELGPSCCLEFFEMLFSYGLSPAFSYGQSKISVIKMTYVAMSLY